MVKEIEKIKVDLFYLKIAVFILIVIVIILSFKMYGLQRVDKSIINLLEEIVKVTIQKCN